MRGGAPRFTKLEPGFRLNCENAADACLRDGDDPPIAAAGAPIVGDSSCWRSGDESRVQNVDGEKVVDTPLIAGLGPPPTTVGRAAASPLGGPLASHVGGGRLAVVAILAVASGARVVDVAAAGGDGAERRVGGRRRRRCGDDGASVCEVFCERVLGGGSASIEGEGRTAVLCCVPPEGEGRTKVRAVCHQRGGPHQGACCATRGEGRTKVRAG